MGKQERVQGRIIKILGESKLKGGIIASIGYILSPLSWWNDVFVNIPIAYVIASLISIVYREAFTPAFIASYLMTNVVGLLMMHYGVEDAVKGRVILTRKTVIRYIIVSTVYTLLVSVLALYGIILPLTS